MALARDAVRLRQRRAVSLRVRVAGVAALLLTVCGTASTLLAERLLTTRMWNSVNASLAEELDDFDRFTAARGGRAGRLPTDARTRSHIGDFLAYNIPAREQALVGVAGGSVQQIATGGIPRALLPATLLQRWARAGTGVQQERGGRFETARGSAAYGIRRVSDASGTHGALVMVSLPAARLREIDELTSVALTVTLATILLGSLAAFLMAERLLAPVQRLTCTARMISRSDLAPRMEPRGDAEVAEMARGFNAMVDRLEDTLTEMRDVAHETAHELRAPLTVCRCQLMAIRDGLQAPDEPARVAIGEIDRMSRLVGDLETLGELRHSRLQTTTFELEPWLRDVFERATRLGPRAWRLESVARVRVRADPDMVARAVLNLARNAAQHTDPAAPIAIGAAYLPDGLRIWVRDGGPGVPQDERKQIFERFARGRESAGRYPGAGLGLAIVSGVARAHGGRIELESRPRAGAMFTMVLPIPAEGSERVPDPGR